MGGTGQRIIQHLTARQKVCAFAGFQKSVRADNHTVGAGGNIGVREGSEAEGIVSQ